MVDKLRKLLAKGVTQTQADAVEKLITLAEQTGVTDDENDQLLSHLRKRVTDARLPTSSPSTTASVTVRARAVRRQQKTHQRGRAPEPPTSPRRRSRVRRRTA